MSDQIIKPKMKISVWVKQSKIGRDYLSCNIEEGETKEWATCFEVVNREALTTPIKYHFTGQTNSGVNVCVFVNKDKDNVVYLEVDVIFENRPTMRISCFENKAKDGKELHPKAPHYTGWEQGTMFETASDFVSFFPERFKQKPIISEFDSFNTKQDNKDDLPF